MASEEQLQIIRQGVDAWNEWREKNPDELSPDLYKADLGGTFLSGAKLGGANLIRADLRRANLSRADLSLTSLRGANLVRASLRLAHLRGANLKKANLKEADLTLAVLSEANLWWADLSGANLSMADLVRAQLVHTDLCNTTLTGAWIYGAAVWDIKMNDQTKQENLVITPGQPKITVDNIEVAQFVYLLLNNQKIREVIDTITSKAVLILGRFSDERKVVLDAIREELRKHDYLPIMFDFPPSPNQTTIETVTTLARMARFAIADLTDARSVLQELEAIVPDLPSLAVLLMIKKSTHEYGMLDKIRKYPWVITDTYAYENEDEVIDSITEKIIGPAETKVKDLRQGN